MHIAFDLIPLDDEARAVGAEHGIGRIFEVAFGIVPRARDHIQRVIAHVVAVQRQRDASAALGIGGQLLRVAAQGRDRRDAAQQRLIPLRLRRLEFSVHLLDIAHRPPDVFGRQEDAEIVIGLEKHALCLHQALPHGAVGGLPEIAALGMLQMRASRDQRDAHIGDRRAGQHADMLALEKMRQDQPLPIAPEHLLGAGGGEMQAAAARRGLEQQMYLGIMPQRLEMSHALDGVRDRFLI